MDISIHAASPSPTGLGTLARSAGQDIEIKTSRPIPGAEVRLPYDADADRFTAGGHTTTPANVFIATYNPSLAVWVPLETRIDTAHHQLVAIAPHFSLFRTLILNPLSKLWDATKTGRQAIIDLVGSSWRSVADIASPRQIAADCSDPDPAYTVGSSIKQLHGCVASGTQAKEVRLENRLLIPLDIGPRAGTGVGQLTEDSSEDSAIMLLTRIIEGGSGISVAGGRGATRLEISPNLATSSQWSVPVTPDLFAIAVDATLTLLNWIPAEHEFELAVMESRVRLLQIVRGGDQLTISELITQIRTVVTGTVSKPEVVHMSEVAANALECEKSNLKALSSFGSPEAAVRATIETAKSCVSTALGLLGTSIKQGMADVIGLIAAIPDLVRLLHEVLQAIGFGFSDSPFAGSRVNVTFSPAIVPHPSPSLPSPCPLRPRTDLSLARREISSARVGLAKSSYVSIAVSLHRPDTRRGWTMARSLLSCRPTR